MTNETIVLALGGNALGNTLKEQQVAVIKTAKVIVDIVEQGKKLVITHGNGPQVGMLQRAMDDYAQKSGDPIPLPTCVAMSQGYIGFDLQNAIKAELASRGINKNITTLLSQIEIDPKDPAFQNPNKPIGRFMTKEEAEELKAQGISTMEDAGRGYRIVVASPKPKRIVELDAIKALLDLDYIVIALGGGAVPVVAEGHQLKAVSAIIDKDNGSAFLAEELDADQLVILTAVEKACLNFNKENQVGLDQITPAQARQYIAEGHFAPGSMLPKVEASVKFAESKAGRKSLITLLDKASEGLAGKTGTTIVS